MPTDRRPAPDLDEHTARLAREWFAEARQRTRDEAAAERRKATRRDRGGSDGDLSGWPFGCSDGDSCDGDGGD